MWELNREHRPVQEMAELAPGREALPPLAAPTTGRHQAAHLLQRFLSGRRLAESGGGHPLPPGIRSRLENSLGVDLAAVRLYEDEVAAQALNARAFALADQIVLRRATDGADPALLAHEAAHVVQARRRGVQAGTSKPGGASERDARMAAQAIQAGQLAPASTQGGPVAAIQRQEEKESTPAPPDPLVRRESVRIMLFLQYQQQGRKEPFALTPTLQSELRRLIPELSSAEITRLWTPAPRNPMVAFQRLIDAGHLSLFAPTPQKSATPAAVKQPAPEPEPKPERESAVSPFGLGMVGLHFKLNPRVPPTIGATIRQRLSQRAIPLDQRQIDALLAGREQGVEEIATILRTVAPSLPEEKRIDLAQTIADVLLDKSLQGQLQRERPTRTEQLEQQVEIFQTAQGNMPSLLERLPVGASVTIYF